MTNYNPVKEIVKAFPKVVTSGTMLQILPYSKLTS